MSGKKLEVVITGDNRGARRAMAEVVDDSSRLGQVLGAVGTAAVAAFKVVAAAATATIGLGVKVGADLQQVDVAFTTMLGSAEKAKAFIQELVQFAIRTPFELPGVVAAARQLMAMGFAAQDVVPMLTAVGNAVGALGGGQEMIERVTRALGQMLAKTRVQAEEMRQLAEAGIPAWQILADTMKVSVAQAMKAVEDRTVESKTFIDAFMAYSARRFGGAMEAQSKTFLGALAVLKDSAKIQLAGVAQPLLDGLTQAMPQIGAMIEQVIATVGPSLTALMTSLIGLATNLMPLIATVVEALGGAFASLLNQLLPVIAQLAPHVEALLTYFEPLFGVLGALVPALGELVVAFGPLLPIIGALALVLAQSLVPVLVPLIEKFAAVATALLGTAEEAGPLTNILFDLATVIEKIPTGVFEFALALYTLNKALVVVQASVKAAAVAMGALKIGLAFANVRTILFLGDLAVTAFKAGFALKALQGFHGLALLFGRLGVAARVLLAPLQLLAFAAKAVAAGVVALAAAIGLPVAVVVAAAVAIVAAGVLIWRHWDKVKGAVVAAWHAIQGAAKAVAGAVASAAKTVASAAVAAYNAVVGFFTSLPGRVVAALAPVPGVLAAFALRMGGAAVDMGARFLNGLVSFLAMLPETIAYWIGFAIGRAIKLWFDFREAVRETVASMVQSVIDTIVEWGPRLIENFWNFLSQLPGQAVDAFTSVWDAITSTLDRIQVFVVDFGGRMIENFINFLQRLPGMVADTFSDVWSAVTSWLQRVVETAIQRGRDFVEAFLDTMSDVLQTVGDWLSRLPGEVVEAINNMITSAREIGGQLVEVFSNMVEKIIQMVADLPGKLWEKGKSIGGSFVNGLKKGLGIASPSLPERYFANIREAAVVSTAAVQGAVGAMGRTLVGTDLQRLKLAGSTLRETPASSVVGAAAASGTVVQVASGAVTVKVEVDGAGDVDVEALADEIAEKIEEKVFRKLAQSVRAG